MRESHFPLMAATLVATFLVGIGFGQDSPDDGLQRAKQAYFESHYREALDQLLAVINDLTQPAQLADARLFLGMSQVALGDEAAARAFFESAVRNNVDLMPTEELFPEESLRLFRSVRSPLVGRVDIRSVPSGARAFVGGRPVGSTPYEGNALVGKQTIRVELEDYGEEEREVEVRPGQVERAVVPLQMTQEAINRLRSEASRQTAEAQKGSKTFYTVLGAVGGGVAAALVLGKGEAPPPPGSIGTLTFENSIGAFQSGGPFVATVGTNGTLSITLTWTNTEAALGLRVLNQAEFRTVVETGPTAAMETVVSLPVNEVYYQIFIQNFTPEATAFTLSYSFPR